MAILREIGWANVFLVSGPTMIADKAGSWCFRFYIDCSLCFSLSQIDRQGPPTLLYHQLYIFLVSKLIDYNYTTTLSHKIVY